MSFTLKTLTEGIRDRHVGQQNKRLVEKWSRTGLLRGMDDVNRENMATLLENQAAQLLREANTMSSDGVGGFTNIAFPIVRRVFGGLVANELVSIQPMSLPSGLLFYLDYTYGAPDGTSHGPYKDGESIYGAPKGKGIQSGALATGGQYDLAGAGFSRQHKTSALDAAADLVDLGAFDPAVAADQKLVQFDADVLASSDSYQKVAVKLGALSSADETMIRDMMLTALTAGDDSALTQAVSSSLDPNGIAHNVRRVNQRCDATGALDPVDGTHVFMLIRLASNKTITADLDPNAAGNAGTAPKAGTVSHVKAATQSVDSASGEVDFDPEFEGDGTGATNVIPEIDIKIESIPVTAQTRKLRARWSPELAQDLNAYHSMDAEVELTQILSEQIALEIDREILSDLVSGASGANFYWSRAPGKFVNKRTGAEATKDMSAAATTPVGPQFTGTVREWYETLTETVIDVANEIHRKTLRGSANFIVVSPDVATILEASVLYRPAYSLDGDGQVGAPFTMGAEKVGTLSNRFTVYKDPYFPRNKILVGSKGGSYLETGFVYAPYVPLIVTPTIFQPDDFTPRKGVMTRYGKKMVRADFFGTVTCLDMNII